MKIFFNLSEKNVSRIHVLVQTFQFVNYNSKLIRQVLFNTHFGFLVGVFQCKHLEKHLMVCDHNPHITVHKVLFFVI